METAEAVSLASAWSALAFPRCFSSFTRCWSQVLLPRPQGKPARVLVASHLAPSAGSPVYLVRHWLILRCADQQSVAQTPALVASNQWHTRLQHINPARSQPINLHLCWHITADCV